MKHPLLQLIWLGFALIASGADKTKGDLPNTSDSQAELTGAGKDLASYQQAFLNLPEGQREEYNKHIREAYRLLADKRIFEVLDELSKAEDIFKDDPERLTLFGSCLVEFRSFEKAMSAFERADKLSPGNPNILFNIGEVYFVTKKWKESSDIFSRVLKMNGEKGVKVEPMLLRLGELKILLCDIKLGKIAEAKVLSQKYDFLDDSPFYFYAQAAMCYQKNDVAAAEDWVAVARRVFQDPVTIVTWEDALVEFGYLHSYYGGGEGAGRGEPTKPGGK